MAIEIAFERAYEIEGFIILISPKRGRHDAPCRGPYGRKVKRVDSSRW